jgi:hypothetical protein
VMYLAKVAMVTRIRMSLDDEVEADGQSKVCSLFIAGGGGVEVCRIVRPPEDLGEVFVARLTSQSELDQPSRS